MPTRASGQKGGMRKLQVSLPTGELRLDLTTDRSSLTDGQASIIEDADVVRPGRLARSSWRRKVNIALPPELSDFSAGKHPITSVIPSNFSGFVRKVRSFESGVRLESTQDFLSWDHD